MISILLGCISPILSAIILGVLKYGQTKAQQREEEHREMHRLTLDVLQSELDMNEVICRCVEHGTHNGDLEVAKQSVATAKSNLEDYLKKKASANI